MSTREYAVNMIKYMTDEQVEAFVDFLSSFLDRNTVSRIESEMLKNDPDPKTYDSFGEFMKEMDEDE